MNKIKSLLITSGVLTTVLMSADPASAQTLGSVMENMFDSSNGLPGFFTGFSYLFGLVLGIMGVLKLKEHVESPGQVPIWDPLKRFLAGGSFFALPFVAQVVQNTITGGSPDLLQGVSGGYNTSGVSGTGLDAMLVRLMADIWGPSQSLILGFCYLAGIALLVIGISRLLKSEQDGPRGPMGIGTIATFLIAGALLSIDTLMASSNFSLFDNIFVNSYATLTYGGGATTAHAEAVIGAILAFVAILGMISFVRGIYMMRQIAEGNSQASMMASLTHILGGSMAINLGAVIEAVQNTLGIASYGIAF